jgi:hypothetical protein
MMFVLVICLRQINLSVVLSSSSAARPPRRAA